MNPAIALAAVARTAQQLGVRPEAVAETLCRAVADGLIDCTDGGAEVIKPFRIVLNEHDELEDLPDRAQ